MLSLTSQVSVSSQQVHRQLGEESVILHLEKNRYFGTRAVGSAIWALLQQPVELSVIASRLLAEFDAPREQIEKDLLEFVTELVDEGLVTIHPR